jgi:NTP pyrophosphatase (non-canonical NTP hydrolase)
MAYRISSAEWPGLAKLAEECSETAQAAAKIIGGCESPEQVKRLEDEIADTYAALRFFIDSNPGINWGGIADRATEKEMRWNAKRARRFVNGRTG